MSKSTKTSVKSAKKNVITVPSLFGLACLLALLCILPWISNQDGSNTFQALQVSIALLLALAGGVCLGLQIAANKSK